MTKVPDQASTCGCGHAVSEHRHNDWSSCQVQGCACAGFWDPPKTSLLLYLHATGKGTPLRSPFSVAEEQHALRLAEEANAARQRAIESELGALSDFDRALAVRIRALAESTDADGGALPAWAWRLRDAAIKHADEKQPEMSVDVQLVMQLLAWAQERKKLLRMIRSAVKTADVVDPRKE